MHDSRRSDAIQQPAGQRPRATTHLTKATWQNGHQSEASDSGDAKENHRVAEARRRQLYDA